MATEKNLELLDDYVANRLSGQEKAAFEQKLETDRELKNQHQLQQQLIEGIKNARVAELKSMLKNVPVPPINGGEAALLTKFVAGCVVASLIGTGAYLFLIKEKEQIKGQNHAAQVEKKVESPKNIAKDEFQTAIAEKPSVDEKKPIDSEQNIKPKETLKGVALPNRDEAKVAEKRKLEVFDPMRESENNTALNEVEPNSSTAVASSIATETDNTNKKYTFHYQFKNDKLFLYGSFEKNLYEILEFFSDNKRTAFLFYKDNYYMLNEDNEKIKPLVPINDPVLLKKLREYRGN